MEQEFRTQKTTRIYLHPYKSCRLVALMRDFSVVNTSLSIKTHLSQKGAAVTLLGSDHEMMDYRVSAFDKVHGGYPIYTLRTKDVNGAGVSMKVFDNDDIVNPVTFIRITVSNDTQNRISGSFDLFPCTAENDRYLTGLWDTGYNTYQPNVKAQYMLDSHYEMKDGTLTDGYAALKVLKCDRYFFSGPNPHFFEPTNYICVPYELMAGESASADFAFALGDRIADYDYELSEKNAVGYWDGFYKDIDNYPAFPTGKYRDIFMAQVTTCLQMVQTYEDGYVYPRQGCFGRYVWEWEAAYFIVPMTWAGLGKYMKEPLQTIMTRWLIRDENNPDCGLLDNPNVKWPNKNGIVIWAAAEYILHTGDMEMYDSMMPDIMLLVKWIEKTRHSTSDGEFPGIFPTMGASDWPERGQHFTYTDSVNVMGYRSLLKLCEKYHYSDTEYIRQIYTDYSARIADIISMLESGHDEDEDYMPTHIVGKNFAEVRTHCYTTDGIVYLPMCGNLDANGKLMGFVERFYERHGLVNHGLTARITNQDWGQVGVYGDCYYTNVAEVSWYYIYKQQGRKDMMAQMLESVYRYNLTDEYQTAERYTPLTEWYAPWQPNASACGRIIMLMLDYYKTE